MYKFASRRDCETLPKCERKVSPSSNQRSQVIGYATLLDYRTLVRYNNIMHRQCEMFLTTSYTSSPFRWRKLFVSLRPPTSVGVTARYPQGKPGLNGHAGRVESHLNTYFVLPGGVEPESNPARNAVNQHKNEVVIEDDFASTVYEVRSERLSHPKCHAGRGRVRVELVANSRKLRKKILSPRSLRSLR